MKYLPYLLLGLGMLLNWTCAVEEIQGDEILENELSAKNLCSDDYAEYYYNDTLFRSKYSPDQGEILTPDKTSCGIGAAFDTNINVFLLRIFGEEHHLNMRTPISTLNTENDFSYVEYTNSNISAPFKNLVLNHQNYILIQELDTLAHTIKGTFNFKIENSAGDTLRVENGVFNCSYHEF